MKNVNNGTETRHTNVVQGGEGRKTCATIQGNLREENTAKLSQTHLLVTQIKFETAKLYLTTSFAIG